MKLSNIVFGGRKFVVVLGIGIIVVTNLVALGGVTYNRAGSPDAIVDFSDRELDLPLRYGIGREDTGIRLRITCRIADTQPNYGYSYGGCGGTPSWLDLAKLNQLGFGLQDGPETIARRWRHSDPLPREAYVVLEFNGDSYRGAVTDAEENLSRSKLQLAGDPAREQYVVAVAQAKKRLDAELKDNSRLFLVDAGHDKAALREKYADPNQYVLMRGLIRPFLSGSGYDEEWKGTITHLLVGSINLPHEYSELFEFLDNMRSRSDQEETAPRYSVKVAFGKRAEPWVVSARKVWLNEQPHATDTK